MGFEVVQKVGEWGGGSTVLLTCLHSIGVLWIRDAMLLMR